MITQIRIFETEEIEHAVETYGIDALLGIGHDTGLRMEGDAQTSLRDHREVVGTIAHGNGLCQIHLLHLSNEFQKLCLTMTVNNLTHIVTSEFTILTDLEFVGIDIIDAITALQVLTT